MGEREAATYFVTIAGAECILKLCYAYMFYSYACAHILCTQSAFVRRVSGSI